MFAFLFLPSTITLSIIFILLLGVGYTDHLTWKECLRLFVIQMGLLFFYFKFKKELTKTDNFKLAVPERASVILALCVIFVLTQFDPATSAVAFGHQQNQFNLFFIFTSGLIGIVGSAFFIYQVRQFSWQSLTLLDRVVIGSVVGITIISIASEMLAGIGFPQKTILFITKIFSYLFVWFLITRNFNSASHLNAEIRHLWLRKIGERKWKMVFGCLMMLFCITLGHGIFRVGKVFHYYYLSQDAQAQHNWKDAEDYFEITQKHNATVDLRFINRRIIGDLAVIYLEIGEDRKAQDLIRSVKEDVTYSESERYRNVGQIYFRAKRWSRAIAEYDGFLKTTGKDIEILDQMGIAYTHLHDIQGILNIVSTYHYMPNVTVQTSEDALFWGNINHYLNNDREARKFFEFASSLNPSDVYSIYKIGRVYLDLAQFQNASIKFSQSIAIAPDFADAYYRLGFCFEKQDMVEDAVKMYKKTVELLPNHREGLISLARLMK